MSSQAPRPLQTLNLNLLVPLEALLRRRSVTRAADELQRKPSEYFGSNVVIITTTGVFDPAVLRAAIDILGPDAVMFSVDYPFESSQQSVDLIERTSLTGEEHDKVAHANADRLLKLKPS